MRTKTQTVSKLEDPYQGVNLQKTELSTIKRLIEFSLDYDIQKPTEASLEREEPKSPGGKPYPYSTMQNRIKNMSESRGELLDDEVEINSPTRTAKFNFKSLKNDE